jgi:pilus assembly protein CpaF
MTLMSGLDLPLTAIREQLASAVHVIVQQQRFACGARRIVEIAEVVGMESGRIQMQPLFRYVTSRSGGEGRFTGCDCLPAFAEKLANPSDLPAELFSEQPP